MLQTTSALARLLAMPKEPDDLAGMGKIVCGWLLIGLAGLFLIGAIASLREDQVAFSVGALLALLIGVPSFQLLRTGIRQGNRATQEYPRAIKRWKKAKAKWKRLYFCHRDGIVFDPQSKKTCNPAKIVKFIYQ